MTFGNIINQNWFSTIIGVIAGLLVSFIIYRVSRVGARPVFQSKSLRLIGMKEQALPEEIEVLYKGKNVPRLTKTYVVFWNSGKNMIDGKDIVPDDQLRLQFPEDSQVLSARIIRETHKPNKFVVNIDKQTTNIVFYSFDYLNPKDGVTLEILHTSKEFFPTIKGSVRGITKGIVDWGYASSLETQRVLPIQTRIIFVIGLVLGILIIITGIFTKQLYEINPVLVIPSVEMSRWFYIIFGLIFASFCSYVLWWRRRRFPKSLSIEDIG